MINPKHILPEYAERSAQMTVATLAESDAALAECNAEFEEASQDVEGGTLRAANAARKAGLLLQARIGGPQMTQIFFDEYLKGRVPFDLKRAQMFMGVARRLTKPASRYKDIGNNLQPMLISAELLELPHREREQTASELTPALKFFSQAIRLREPLAKWELNEPMDTWGAGDLRRFLSETDWLANDRERATKLLAKLGRAGKG